MPLAFYICPSYFLAIVMLVTPFVCFLWVIILLLCFLFSCCAWFSWICFYCVIWELILCHGLVFCELLFSDVKSVSWCSSFLSLFSNHWIDGSLPVKLSYCLLSTAFFLAAAVKGSVSSCVLCFKNVSSLSHSQYVPGFLLPPCSKKSYVFFPFQNGYHLSIRLFW